MKSSLFDHSHIGLSYITHFYCNKPGGFEPVRSLLDAYAGYPSDLLDRIQFVVVDDGSPIPCEPPDVDLNLIWLRVREDIPWNNPGARNLGATYAKSDKIILTDIDHQFPEETFRHVLARKECGRSFFKFRRLQQENPTQTHANTFLMSRGRFLRLWGYDEQFCGHYAHDDVWFVKFQKWHGSRERNLPARYPIRMRTKATETRDLTHTLDRDLTTNRKLYAEKRKRVERFGAHQGHSRRFLAFNWDVVLMRRRSSRPVPSPNRMWKPLWWFRSILPAK